jgi:hypothetical protein
VSAILDVHREGLQERIDAMEASVDRWFRVRISEFWV